MNDWDAELFRRKRDEARAEVERLETRVKVLEEALRSVTDWKDAAEVVAPELGGMHKAMFAARAALQEQEK